MKKKTYGVSGYIEWVAGIKAGSVTLQVPFTGGAITKYGIVPAEYTTSDPVIQHLIENSRQYHDKLIRLIREETISDDTKAGAGKKTDTFETIHVARLTDAVQILHDRYGVPSAKALSPEAAKSIGLDHKIKFVGI